MQPNTGSREQQRRSSNAHHHHHHREENDDNDNDDSNVKITTTTHDDDDQQANNHSPINQEPNNHLDDGKSHLSHHHHHDDPNHHHHHHHHAASSSPSSSSVIPPEEISFISSLRSEIGVPSPLLLQPREHEAEVDVYNDENDHHNDGDDDDDDDDDDEDLKIIYDSDNSLDRECCSYRRSPCSQERKPFRLAKKFFRRITWSFTSVFLFTFLSALLLVGISMVVMNRFIIQPGVATLVEELRVQLLHKNIVDKVRNYLTTGPSVLHRVVNDLKTGDRLGYNYSDARIVNSQKAQILMFFAQTKNPMVDSIWFGTRDNYFTAVGVLDHVIPHQSLSIQISTGNGSLYQIPLTQYFAVDKPNMVRVTDRYYANRRPWYMKVIETNKMIWSELFVTMSVPQHIGIVLSAPYNDPVDNSILGVVSTGISLENLSVYLSSLDVFPQTKMFIVQSNMVLIASNMDIHIGDNAHHSPPVAIDVRNSTDRVVRETGQEIFKRFGIPLRLNNQTISQFTFKDSQGNGQLVGMIGITDPYGLYWNCVVVLSENEVLRSIKTSNRIISIVSTSIILVALLIAIIISVLISVPLNEIAREFYRITKMSFRRRRDTIHSLLFSEIATMSTSIQQLKNGLRSFDAFVPSYVVRLLLSRNASAKLGVIKRRLTIMFVDISLSLPEKLSPSLLLDMLQMTLTSLSDIVTEEDGIVDKYLPEGIMCLFNSPITIRDHELRSIRAACKMVQKTTELNREWTKSNQSQLVSIRIGVNTDQCLVGNIGSKSRVSYTAIGDAVNVASRLVSLNKRYDTRIIIGPKTQESVQRQYLCKWIACICVKGKSLPINVFEILAERSTATEEQIDVEVVMSQVRRWFETNNLFAAHSVLVKLCSRYPDDKSFRELRDRLESSDFSPFLKIETK